MKKSIIFISCILCFCLTRGTVKAQKFNAKKMAGNNTTEEIIVDNNDKIREVIKSLGILPNIQSKLVICVEGETDIMFIESISKLQCIKDIIDLERENISIIPMRGGNLKSWIDKNYFKDSNVKEIHIYDSDVTEYIKKVDEINKNNDGRRQ